MRIAKRMARIGLLIPTAIMSMASGQVLTVAVESEAWASHTVDISPSAPHSADDVDSNFGECVPQGLSACQVPSLAASPFVYRGNGSRRASGSSYFLVEPGVLLPQAPFAATSVRLGYFADGHFGGKASDASACLTPDDTFAASVGGAGGLARWYALFVAAPGAVTSGTARLRVFGGDINGVVVKWEVVDNILDTSPPQEVMFDVSEPGVYDFTFPTEGVPAGVYLLKVEVVELRGSGVFTTGNCLAPILDQDIGTELEVEFRFAPAP